MTRPEDSDKDKMVGYRRPPVATQFKKGQSGNPKGRPKGRTGVGKILWNALYRIIEVRESGRVRSMPKIQAVIEVNLNKALKGDHRAFAKVMDIIAKLGVLELPPNEKNLSDKIQADEAFQIIAKALDAAVYGDIEDESNKNSQGNSSKT